jgi:anti-anti-sigma factor
MSTHFAAGSAGNPLDRNEPNVVEYVAVRATGGTDVIRFSVSHPRGDVTLIEVAGEVDLCTAPQLRERLLRACDFRDRIMVVDLSPVTFFAAAGVTTLIEVQVAVEKSDRRLFLIATCRCVGRVLDITGLSTRFRCVGSLDAALADGYGATA